MTFRPTRRAALGLLATAAGAALPLARPAPAAAQGFAPPFGPSPFTGAGPAAAPGTLRLSRIAVDASRLRTPFNGINADLLTRDLDVSLRRVFADLAAPRGAPGATLLARVNSLYLPPWAGDRHGSGLGPDNIEGVGLVLSGGRIVSQTPLYTTLDPSYSGAWFLPDIDRRRLASIAYQFAYWLRREMGV